MNTIAEFLSKAEPFVRLPVPVLHTISQSAQIIKHSKGEYIFSEGDEASSVWVLKSGRLDIYKYSSGDKARVIETITPMELFGTLCRIGGEGRTYPCTAMAAVDSTSIRIPEKLFMGFFHQYPSMVSGVCALCSQRLNQMQDLSCSTQESVDKRILNVLLSLTKKYGNVIPFTKREIAERAATTVETAIRVISKFQKNGWVKSERGKIIIVDLEKAQSVI